MERGSENEGNVGMHHAKNSGKEVPFSNTIKDTSTIMRNPTLHILRVTHDCASIFDSIAKGTSYFSHGASLHRHSLSGMIVY